MTGNEISNLRYYVWSGAGYSIHPDILHIIENGHAICRKSLVTNKSGIGRIKEILEIGDFPLCNNCRIILNGRGIML